MRQGRVIEDDAHMHLDTHLTEAFFFMERKR